MMCVGIAGYAVIDERGAYPVIWTTSMVRGHDVTCEMPENGMVSIGSQSASPQSPAAPL